MPQQHSQTEGGDEHRVRPTSGLGTMTAVSDADMCTHMSTNVNTMAAAWCRSTSFSFQVLHALFFVRSSLCCAPLTNPPSNQSPCCYFFTSMR